jgi:hypothetical protein
MKLAIPHSPFITHALLLTVIAFSTLNSQLSTAFAQGSLTPPRAPAPTMKSLDQIEPRTPVDATHTPGNSFEEFIITQPGSYYLTSNINLTNGEAIAITTNGVTLDLNGFTISSTDPAGTAYAIRLAVSSGNGDITIFNGHIKGGVTNNGTSFSGPGFGSAINTPGTLLQNVRITGISISGCSYYGIYLGTGSSTVVESCTVQNIGFMGIFANSVSHSTAYQCGNYGIYAYAADDCTGQGVGSGIGISTTTANNCYGYSTGSGAGLAATTANNCYGYSAGSGTGLWVTGTAIGCYGQSVSGIGINAHIANSCMVGGGTTNITYKYNMP